METHTGTRKWEPQGPGSLWWEDPGALARLWLGLGHRTAPVTRAPVLWWEGLQAFCFPQNGGSGKSGGAFSICTCPTASVGQGLAVSVLGLTGPFGRRAMVSGYREAGFS